MKKRIKRIIKKLLKKLLKNTIALIVAIFYLIYLLFKTINKLVVKAFNKLPRVLKVALIYTLIIGNLPHFITIYKTIDNLEINTKSLTTAVAIVEKVETTETVEIETIEETEIVEEKNTCQLSSEIECKIYNKAIEKELTHEQAILLVAISKHETGNWTSYNFKNKNNLGGLYNGSKGTFYSYESLESGIEAFVNLLKNRYFGRGLNTIEEIGNVYCPVGASNDPNGLNKHWIPKVSQFYNEYLEK